MLAEFHRDYLPRDRVENAVGVALYCWLRILRKMLHTGSSETHKMLLPLSSPSPSRACVYLPASRPSPPPAFVYPIYGNPAEGLAGVRRDIFAGSTAASNSAHVERRCPAQTEEGDDNHQHLEGRCVCLGAVGRPHEKVTGRILF